MKVEKVMTKEVTFFGPGEQVSTVARVLREKGISGTPVVEEGKLVGVVSETDIMRMVEDRELKINLFLPSPFDVLELPVKMRKKVEETMEGIKRASAVEVGEIMTKKVITISPGADVSEAARIMDEMKVNRLPVVDEKGELRGIVTRGDIIGSLF